MGLYNMRHGCRQSCWHCFRGACGATPHAILPVTGQENTTKDVFPARPGMSARFHQITVRTPKDAYLPKSGFWVRPCGPSTRKPPGFSPTAGLATPAPISAWQNKRSQAPCFYQRTGWFFCAFTARSGQTHD